MSSSATEAAPRRSWLPPSLAALVAGAVFARVVWRMTEAADFPAHIEAARSMFAGGDVPVHPGYHLAVSAVHALTPAASWRVSAAIVTLMGVMGLAAILGTWIAEALAGVRPGLSMAAVVALPVALMVVQPALPWPQGERNQWLAGYISVNQWHNPTTLLVRPFGLLLFGYGVISLAGGLVGRGAVRWAAALSLASLVVKPNVLLALLPALGVGSLVRWRRVNWRLVAAIALPAVAGLLVQYLYYFSGASESSRVEFRPFYVIGLSSSSEPWTIATRLIAAVLFPLIVTISFLPVRRDSAMLLAWGMFLAGAAQAYLLAEGGGDAEAGNFMWSATIANATLYAVAAVVLLRLIASPAVVWSRAFSARVALCTVVFAYHVLSGGTHLYRSWFA